MAKTIDFIASSFFLLPSSFFLLRYHLRHRPDKIGLTLKLGGLVCVNELLIAAAKDNFPMELMELQEVVRNNETLFF